MHPITGESPNEYEDEKYYQIQHTVNPSPYKEGSRLVDSSLPQNKHIMFGGDQSPGGPGNQSFDGSQFFSDD